VFEPGVLNDTLFCLTKTESDVEATPVEDSYFANFPCESYAYDCFLMVFPFSFVSIKMGFKEIAGATGVGGITGTGGVVGVISLSLLQLVAATAKKITSMVTILLMDVFFILFVFYCLIFK